MYFLVILVIIIIRITYLGVYYTFADTEKGTCLCLVFTLDQQFKKLLPCFYSINDSLNLEGLISCLRGSSEGEISAC